MLNKKQLIDLIIKDLSEKLKQAVAAANEAHAAAVDDQSVAETQYDTLAIEASYLAEGQSKRVKEFQHDIDMYEALDIVNFNDGNVITLGALVQLSTDAEINHWFFIGPSAGGFRCKMLQQEITVITPKSPIGKALIGKYIDDDIEVLLGSTKREDYITAVK